MSIKTYLSFSTLCVLCALLWIVSYMLIGIGGVYADDSWQAVLPSQHPKLAKGFCRLDPDKFQCSLTVQSNIKLEMTKDHFFMPVSGSVSEMDCRLIDKKFPDAKMKPIILLRKEFKNGFLRSKAFGDIKCLCSPDRSSEIEYIAIKCENIKKLEAFLKQ